MDYQIIKTKRIFDDYFKIDEIELRRETFRDGGFESIRRYHIARPQAVGIILKNISTNKIILVQQFRYAALKKTGSTGWTTEIPAGLVDSGESPEQAARREAFEETGYTVNKLSHILTYFTCIGISDEQIHLYFGQVSNQDKSGEGGGVEEQSEDLNVVELDIPALLQMIKAGEIYDGKTIISAQWLALRQTGETR